MTMQRIPEYYQGYRDFMEGRLNNPYRPNTIKAKEWQHGQDHAYLDQQKKLGVHVQYRRARPDLKAKVSELKQFGFAAAAAHFERHGLVLTNASL